MSNSFGLGAEPPRTSAALARLVLVALLAVALLALECVVPSTAVADSILGRWTGTVEQYPVGTSQTYTADMTLTSPTSGTIDYPSLNCGGTLSGGGSGGVYRFRESIRYGRVTSANPAGCFDGNIDMTVHGDTMTWQWSGSFEGQSYSVSGTLRRVSSPPASWSRGEWKAVGAVEVIIPGKCFITWTCVPGEQMMRSPDTQVLSTPSARTRGDCTIKPGDPKSCGVCNASKPMAECACCVQPKACDNPSLGSRTREAMGCCPAR